jgi:hypothetical protein
VDVGASKVAGIPRVDSPEFVVLGDLDEPPQAASSTVITKTKYRFITDACT